MLTHSASTETIILLMIAMISYNTSAALQKSGIISLLTTGIFMAHFTWYNLSPQGKTVSSVTFSITGSGAESFVFAYIGLCTFSYAAQQEEYPWDKYFVMIILSIVIFARTFATFFSHGVLRLCCLKSPSDVNFKELIFICYGGMIRGAIAFGLVLKIPTDAKGAVPVNPHKGIIVTTTLALVIITTVVFGSFMPIV
jgi:NhaP-type Na+/H+ or K+/H+ antiporter